MAYDDEERNEDPDPTDQDPDYDDGATATMDCPYCGKPIVEEAEFCHHCGKYISEEETHPKQPMWFLVGIVLCILLLLAVLVLGLGKLF